MKNYIVILIYFTLIVTSIIVVTNVKLAEPTHEEVVAKEIYNTCYNTSKPLECAKLMKGSELN